MDNLRVSELLKKFHNTHPEAVKSIKLAPLFDFKDKAIGPSVTTHYFIKVARMMRDLSWR